MFREVIAADCADPQGWPALAEAIRRWEPELEVYLPPRHARLYEPDGTLYAVALADGLTVASGSRAVVVNRGDLLVVPAALALDIEPEAALLCVRCEGAPPPHFRERFIQVWGFEHLPATGGATPIDDRDARHRLSYAVREVSDAEAWAETTNMDVFLFVVLHGDVRIRVVGREASRLHAGMVAAVGPDSVVAVEGRGRVGRLILRSEPVHRGRTAGGAPAPEYDPNPAARRLPGAANRGPGGAAPGGPGPLC